MADETTPQIRLVTFVPPRVNLSKIDITKAPKKAPLIAWYLHQQHAEKYTEKQGGVPDITDDM